MKSWDSAIVAAIMTVLLLGTITVITITNPKNVFAYKSQSASQTSSCENDFVPTIAGQNTDSQIQGDKNAATLRAQQTLPEIRLVQKEPPEALPPTEPQTCVGCLAPLLDHEGLASSVCCFEPSRNPRWSPWWRWTSNICSVWGSWMWSCKLRWISHAVGK